MAVTNREYDIYLDLNHKGQQERIEFQAQSVNAAVLHIYLTKDYDPVNLADVIIEVAYEGVNNDTKALSTTLDITNKRIINIDTVNGKFDVLVHTNALAKEGKVKVQVTTLQGDKQQIFPPFTMNIRDSIDLDGEILKDVSYPVLMDSINKTENATTNAIAATNTINTTNANMHVWEEFNLSKAYKPLNKVLYNGNSYVCLLDSQGVFPPTDTNRWKLISISGKDGFSSIKEASYIAVADGVTNIVIGFSDYDPVHDKLEVKFPKYNAILTESDNYIVSADNLSVNLIDMSLNVGDELIFRVYKFINQDKIGDIETLQTQNKTSLVNAINENTDKIGILLENAISTSSFGTSDSLTDNSAAINNAILFAYTMTKNRTVKIPKSTNPYIINSEIKLYSGIKLISDGAEIKAGTMNDGMMIRNYHLDASGYNGDSDILVDGLIINGDNKACGGIGVAHTTNTAIRNCKIKNFTGILHCIDAPANQFLKIENNSFENCVASMVQIDCSMTGSLPTITTPNLNEDNTSSESIWILNNMFKNGKGIAIHLHKESHKNIKIDGNIILDCGYGISDDGNYTAGHRRLTITNNVMDLRNSEDTTLGHCITLNSGIADSTICDNILIPRRNGIYLSNLSTRYHELVTINNNIIRETKASAIYLDNVRRTSVSCNQIIGFGDGVSTRYGIKINGSNTVNVTNNSVTGTNVSYGHGISLADSVDCNVIENNVLSVKSGIYVERVAVIPSGNCIKDNKIIYVSDYGIYVAGIDASNRAKNISIIGNTIKTATLHGIRTLYLDGATINNNEIVDTATNYAAISLSTFKNGVVNNNRVNNTTKCLYGISISSTGDGYSTLIGNRVDNCTNGIAVLNADYCTIVGNITSNCTTHIDASGVNNIKANNIAI